MNLQTFDFQEAPVRVALRDGAPWFVAADVCRVLDIVNGRDAVGELDEDEKITVANADGNPRGGIPHQLNIISESGLYALVFKSRKPEAKKFRKWVTAEVLPALRETGRYEAAGAPQTVRDELAALRGLLINSARSVAAAALDVGRAQQVAILAGRYLETIKLEGDARGYEEVFAMRSGEGGGGFLRGDGRLQGVPQRGLCGTQAARSGLSGAAVCGEAALDASEPADGACAPAARSRPADLGRPEGRAADLPAGGGGPVGALGRDLRT